MNQPSLLALYLTVFISIAGFSMIFPLLPFYAREFHANPFQIGLLAATHALASFLAAPLIGGISDRIGRKPVMLVGILLSCLSLLGMGLANSLTALFAARTFHGLVTAAILPTSRAYVGDITSQANRVAGMGRIGAAFSSGMLLGPALSSLFISWGGIQLPFFVAATIALFNAISVALFLPESLQRKTDHLHLKKGYTDFLKLFGSLTHPTGLLFLILFTWAFSLSNLQVSIPLLASDKFQLGAGHIGYFFTALALVSVTVQGYLLPRIIKLIGERLTIMSGMATMAAGLLFIPLAPTVSLLIVSFMSMGLGSSLNRPTAEGIISASTEVGQGSTMGLAQSFESLGRILGPLLSGLMYAYSDSLPFIFSSAMLLLLTLALAQKFKHTLTRSNYHG